MKQIITYKIKKTLNNQRKNYYIFEKIEFDIHYTKYTKIYFRLIKQLNSVKQEHPQWLSR